ncbi:hippocalcin-like protein 1 [Lepeophtheirus salmonis]|nr:hippocalcin-like protein 1 [Lepeophtheirus salmonis]
MSVDNKCSKSVSKSRNKSIEDPKRKRNLSELESSEDSIGLLARFTNWIQQLKRKIMMKEEDIQGAVPLSSKSRIRLQNLTGLSDDEIKSRRKEFYQQFPEGFVTVREFQRISAKVLSRDEIGKFTENVFHLFDSDKDNRLSFEEFTIATSVSESAGPLEKLQWLFDNVYDKDHSGSLTRSELEEILANILKQEHIRSDKGTELINDIFRELDENKDGLITKQEFIHSASGSVLLWEILSSVAEKERRKHNNRSSRKKSKRQK